MSKDFDDFLREHEENVNKLKKRDKETESDKERARDEFSRDYSRVIYSNSFRRQQGKMQLFAVNGRAFHRNRLTHSFEVAQIARGIVDYLKKNTSNNIDIDFNSMSVVVETGALVHDIGNPPFGHHGERILNDLAKDIGFEGNAQGLRVLKNIEKKSPDHKGLNLTYRTLASILKYYVPYRKSRKTEKFIYKEDYEEFKKRFKEMDVFVRTIDVQIVDLADEIAYCAHDLEDALASNYFTIDQFVFLLEQKLGEDQTLEDFKEWIEEAKNKAKRSKSNDDYDFYFRRELLSIIVNKFIEDIDIVELNEKDKKKLGTDQDQELGLGHYKKLAGALKKTIFEGVTNSDDIILYGNVGTKVLTRLFALFMNEEYNRESFLMPIEYRFEKDDTQSDKKRKVLDYISGMMDTYAIEMYIKHFGTDPFLEKYDAAIFKKGTGKKLIECLAQNFLHK
ncbi:dNTP triphosphohydrolase [Streptococcus suis]|uniref:deoxyguanosinetriphosphate triphosphohydrolase family protein n=1 Tax=Streptococcus suis TaxID=1307 RepID=UPI001ECC9DC4|nr:dNTP triphosphohydrolase [Streptococcus suis]MBS7990014.1 dNTP triphosphohydrolase [Streptococcus suis]